jgi:hypothetical protein
MSEAKAGGAELPVLAEGAARFAVSAFAKGVTIDCANEALGLLALADFESRLD